MPPKKKKGKKKKEIVIIEDEKMLRLIGEHKEAEILRLKLCYEKRDGPIQLNIVISDLHCVHHLYRELWRRLDLPWGREYIFITTLPKTEQNSFTFHQLIFSIIIWAVFSGDSPSIRLNRPYSVEL